MHFAVITIEYVTTSKHYIELLVRWHIDKPPKVTLLHIAVDFYTGSAVDEPSKSCISLTINKLYVITLYLYIVTELINNHILHTKRLGLILLYHNVVLAMWELPQIVRVGTCT